MRTRKSELLKPAGLGKRIGFSLADNKVVKDVDLNALHKPFQLMGEYHVVVAGLRAAHGGL